MALKSLRRLLDWRAVLVYTHRWLGIAGCALFIAWFFSGIVMMYARMPELADEETLARAPALDLSTATLTPGEAAARAGVAARGVQVSMLQDRPVYRFSGGGRRERNARPAIVFADTGERFHGLAEETALEAARRFEPSYTGTVSQRRVDDRSRSVDVAVGREHADPSVLARRCRWTRSCTCRMSPARSPCAPPAVSASGAISVRSFTGCTSRRCGGTARCGPSSSSGPRSLAV